jgi:hypothetical protein
MQPEWRRDGKELFYLSGDGKIMAVDVATDGAEFAAGVPLELFDVDIPEATSPTRRITRPAATASASWSTRSSIHHRARR